MGQEYFINSQALENKVRNLLPSQGGSGAGQDLSASTQIVPIVDLTEQAEGSNVRADLQTALSHDTITAFNVSNLSTTIINNTGYFRIFGNYNSVYTTSARNGLFAITDGVTSKTIIEFESPAVVNGALIVPYDFIVFCKAGDSVTAQTVNTGDTFLTGCTRQIADIDGNLVNP